jgi:prepilin-type N-terminal cleavage/methylation domain-containing protein
MKNQRGFSLLEMVMMIAVGAVLFTGISRASQTQIKSAIDNRNYLVALNLAKWRMAIMNNLAYPASATTTPTSDTSFPDFTFSQVVSADVATSGVYSIRSIQLDVLNGAKVIVRLNTYRTNVATFGNGS